MERARLLATSVPDEKIKVFRLKPEVTLTTIKTKRRKKDT
jgi:hypothetical protein